MKTIENEIPFFQTLPKLSRNQFGMKSKFILHDWLKGYGHSIVATENGYITSRKIGDCGGNLGLEVIRETTTGDMKRNYVTCTRKRKVLLSSTMYIKNDNEQTLGVLCTNTDIPERIKIKECLDSSPPEELDKKGSNEEFFAINVSDLLVYLIDRGASSIGRPVSEMTKENKVRVLRFPDDRGAFLISKSNTKICQILEISKFTLYSYLDEAHERRESIQR